MGATLPSGAPQTATPGCRPRQPPGVGRLVHRYKDASRVGACPAVYSSNVGEPGAYLGISEEPFSDEVQALVDQYHPMTNVLFRADPPLHARQRALVTKALSARRVRALEPSIVEIVDDVIVLTGPDLLTNGRRPEDWPLQRDPLALETSVPGRFPAGDVRHNGR